MAVFSTTRDFHKKFAFTVEIPGFGWTGFKDCSDIKIDVAKIQHWEGGALAPEQSPGRVTTQDVTLKRGATDDLDLWNWLKEIIDASGMVTEPNHQKQVSVVQRDRRQTERKRWVLVDSWITSATLGGWDNNADENTIEEMVLAVRYANLGGDNPA